MPAVSSEIIRTEPVNRSIEMLRAEMRMEDGESQWKSEREKRKEETSRESETVRLAIINHIRCWRRQCILATRQTLRLSSIPVLSSANGLVALNTHTALGHAPKTHGRVQRLCLRPANWSTERWILMLSWNNKWLELFRDGKKDQRINNTNIVLFLSHVVAKKYSDLLRQLNELICLCTTNKWLLIKNLFRFT